MLDLFIFYFYLLFVRRLDERRVKKNYVYFFIYFFKNKIGKLFYGQYITTAVPFFRFSLLSLALVSLKDFQIN